MVTPGCVLRTTELLVWRFAFRVWRVELVYFFCWRKQFDGNASGVVQQLDVYDLLCGEFQLPLGHDPCSVREHEKPADVSRRQQHVHWHHTCVVGVDPNAGSLRRGVQSADWPPAFTLQ